MQVAFAGFKSARRKDKSMIEGKPSETALLVAACRAHHYLTAREPKILCDKLAMRLAGFGSPAEVDAYVKAITDRFAGLGDRDAAEAIIHEIVLAVCIRSRIVEDLLEASLTRGTKQLVLLGAGLDSTAYRRPDLTKTLRVFEVDHPASQAWKRERLKALDIAVPQNLSYVSFDFERQTLAEALDAGGVRRDEMTFFPWLGVVPYLTDDTVLGTLGVIADFPTGSEFVADIVGPTDHTNSAQTSEGMRQLLAVVAKMGEPFKSLYREEEFAKRLIGLGFDTIIGRGPADWNKTYLAGRAEDLGHVPEDRNNRIFSARVGVKARPTFRTFTQAGA